MSEISLSDNLIKEFLIKEAEQIEANNETISIIKSRINSETVKKRPFNFANFKIHNSKKELAAVICCLFAIVSLSMFFISPVRAFARNSYNEIKKMVYSVFVSDDGSYSVTQISKEDAIKGKKARSYPRERTYLSDSELSKEIGYQVKIPDSLEGTYLLTYKAFGPIYEAPAENIDDTNGSTIESSFNENKTGITPNNEVAAIYNSGSNSNLVLIINNSEKADPFMSEKNLKTYEKSQDISGITSQYYEMPNVEYTDKENVSSYPVPDITKPPVKIGTASILTWCDQGVYYYLIHDNSFYKIPFDDLKAAAASIITH